MANVITPLLKHQKIYIDAHGQEINPITRPQIYDGGYDLHLDKRTNPIKINGKEEHNVHIRIPLNKDGEATWTIGKNKQKTDLPSRLVEEIQKVCGDKTKLDNFAKQVTDIITEYPSIKSDREKTEEVLRRIADALALPEIQIKDEWFTHINQDKNGVSMLSLVSDNSERYNILTCDNFMMAEQAEQTKKTIIRLYGAAYRGKTSTIKRVFRALIEEHPDHAIIISNGEGKSDVKAILFVNGAKVGIESQGDPNSRQMRTIDEFVSMGCDVILVAGRTRGMTRDSIYKYQDEYEIEERYKPYVEDKADRELKNGDEAMVLRAMVEAATLRTFEEL